MYCGDVIKISKQIKKSGNRINQRLYFRNQKKSNYQ